MAIQIKINDIDVSSYVLNCEKIPVIYRNRNWEPVAKGFNFNISQSYPNAVNSGETVEVLYSNAGIYLGLVDIAKNIGDTRQINIKVTNYLNKLADYKVKRTDIYNAIVLCGNFTGAKTFAPTDVDTGTDVITCTAHGIPAGPAVPIQFNSTGSLPAPLLRNWIYYAVRIDNDRFDVQSIPSGSALDLTTQGTGTHSFTLDLDLNKYIAYDNEGYPNTAIWWVLKNIFTIAGLTLNSSLVDATVIHTENIGGTDYNFTWLDFVFDVNMLFATNQSDAKITYGTSELNNHITFQELVFKLLGIFGFAIRYNGNTSNKQYTIYPYSNTPQTIDDDTRYSYSDNTEYGTTDVYGYEMWAARSAYASATPSSLDEQNYYSNGDYENNNIWWWTNFKIYYRKKSGTPNPGDIETTTTFTLEKASTNQINAFSADYTVEEAEIDIDFNNATIKENYLDVENMTSVIIQETIL